MHREEGGSKQTVPITEYSLSTCCIPSTEEGAMKGTEQYRTCSLPFRGLQSRWRQEEPGENSPGQHVNRNVRCLGSDPLSASMPPGAQCSVLGKTITPNSQGRISPLSIPYPQPLPYHLKTSDSLFSCYQSAMKWGRVGQWGRSLEGFQGLVSRSSSSKTLLPETYP